MDNSTYHHIHQNISLEFPKENETIQGNLCKKILKPTRGLKIHERSCKNNLLDDKSKLLDEVLESSTIIIGAAENNTNRSSKVSSEGYENVVNETYEQMVFWKKNIFLIPSNSADKQFVDELTKLIECWMSNSPSSTTALKSLMLLPNLLLQTSSNKASNTINQKHLSRILELWKKGKVNALLSECIAIQNRQKTSNSNNR